MPELGVDGAVRAGTEAMPALAIVTMCKDDLDGLARTLASTGRLRRSYPIVHRVIDGSSDDYRERARQIAESHPGVHYHWLAPTGTSDAMNYALKIVAEPWVWFLNSGDVLLDSFNISVLAELLASTSAKVVTFSIINNNGELSRPPPVPFMWPPVFTWLCFPATVFRTEELIAIGGFDRRFKFANDGEMWFRLLGKRSVTLDIISMPMVLLETAGMSGDRKSCARDALASLKKHRYLILKRWIQSGLLYFEAKRKNRRRLAK